MVNKKADLTESSESTLEERHRDLQLRRRELETELAAVDSKLRDAINAGDVAVLNNLTADKAKLPKLFIAASMAETGARHEIFNTEDQANLKLLEAAESERDKQQASFKKRELEIEVELAELKTKVVEAEQKVNEIYASITASRDLGASGDEGFKKSLAALAGV